ncbi:MAG TPA: hypothetical protein VNZ06_14775 [Steroidobacteraceae bacterium]|nr:hypothetical protein [Steroidobacteraceae bacterium]
MYRFLLKPCNPADLVSTIERALDHKRLEEHSRSLLRQFRKQAALLNALERERPGLLSSELDDSRGLDSHDVSSGDLAQDLQRELGVSQDAVRRWLEH